MTWKVKVGLLAILVLVGQPLPSFAQSGIPVPGRIVLELTEEGARILGRGQLRIPVPPGGEALEPRIQPLFAARSGPLARYAILTFNSDLGPSGDPIAENAAWIEAARGFAEVIQAEPDQAFRMSALPNDPYLLGDGGLPEQFHLMNPAGLSLEAVRAWPFVPAGHGVVVGILDSGVDWRHPDLGGPSPPGGVIQINQAEADGTPGEDDDENGYVDDVIGWDFVHLTSAPGGGANPASGEDSTVPDNDPADFAGHGTQVAGFVTAITDNGIGIAGGIPDARILPVRVGWQGIDGGAWVLMSFCAQGIEYAALNGAQVINCSWDSADLQGLGLAVDLAINTYDIVVVGSAGNEGKSTSSIQYVAMRPDVLGVAGVLESGIKANPSNYGSWVSIAAFFRGSPSTHFDSGTGSSTYLVNPAGGTSFAAPQVAGLAALLRAVDPLAGAATIRATIENNGRDLSFEDPVFGGLLGGGLADFAKAAQALGSGWDHDFRARGLTEFGPLRGSFAAMGDSTIELFGVEIMNEPDDRTPINGFPMAHLPVVAHLGTHGDILVWEDGTVLSAVDEALEPASGWPVDLPQGAGQAVAYTAIRDSEGPEKIYVPHRDDVLVLFDDGGGLDSTSLGLPLVSMAIGHPTLADSVRVVAGVDSSRKLVVWTEGPDLPGTPVTVDLDSVSTALAIGEFIGPTQGEVVVVDDRVDPGPTRNVYFVAPNGVVLDSVAVNMGRVAALSLAGFSIPMAIEVVLVDHDGRLNLIDRNGRVLERDLGCPVAGEVLCVDMNDDFRPDLVAMCQDGTLHAWDRNLEPLPGFPRRFPNGVTEPPLILDGWNRPNGEDQRFVVVADTSGVLWSVPFDSKWREAPWPTARRNRGRSGFLEFASWETPVNQALVSLSWDWNTESEGALCWSGTATTDYLRFRVIHEAEELWVGSNGDAGCITVGEINAGEQLRFEGMGRAGSWDLLGTLTVPSPVRFTAGRPYPNPFRSGTRLTWSGAAVRGVRIAIFDVRGRRLFEESRSGQSGEFLWTGLDRTGRPVSPGAYFIRMDDGEQTAVRRILRLD